MRTKAQNLGYVIRGKWENAGIRRLVGVQFVRCPYCGRRSEPVWTLSSKIESNVAAAHSLQSLFLERVVILAINTVLMC